MFETPAFHQASVPLGNCCGKMSDLAFRIHEQEALESGDINVCMANDIGR